MWVHVEWLLPAIVRELLLDQHGAEKMDCLDSIMRGCVVERPQTRTATPPTHGSITRQLLVDLVDSVACLAFIRVVVKDGSESVAYDFVKTAKGDKTVTGQSNLNASNLTGHSHLIVFAGQELSAKQQHVFIVDVPPLLGEGAIFLSVSMRICAFPIDRLVMNVIGKVRL